MSDYEDHTTIHADGSRSSASVPVFQTAHRPSTPAERTERIAALERSAKAYAARGDLVCAQHYADLLALEAGRAAA